MKKANAPAPADVQVLLPAAMMNGKAVVDSREVARMLGRPHKNLLADIHRYISAMERRKADGLNFQPVARDFQLVDFFVPSTYTNDHNQTFPCYLLTQKAIRALLDVDTLKGSDKQDEAITAALAALQKDSGYLFESGETPPPYAAGTGSTALHGADADTAMRQAMGLPIDN